MAIFSICIPRVFKNIGEKRILAIFKNLRFGSIERIDMVPKSNEKGDEFWRVFIHFNKWYDNENATHVRTKLEQGNRVKIVYDEPWYWLISKSNAPMPSAPGKRRERPAPFIDFGHTKTDDRDERSSAPTPQSPEYAPSSPSNAPHTPTEDPTAPTRSYSLANDGL